MDNSAHSRGSSMNGRPASAILDLVRTSAVLVEIGQLDRYRRDETARASAAGRSPRETAASLRPVFDRLDQLLTEFQALSSRLATANDIDRDAARANLTQFVSLNRAVGLGVENNVMLVDTAFQDQFVFLVNDQSSDEFDAAAAEAAAIAAAAAEAERQRLEAEAAQLAAGGGGGGGGGAVEGIASAIIEAGMSTGGSSSGGGGHPFTVLGCMAGAMLGSPELGCLGGFLVDHVMLAEDESET